MDIRIIYIIIGLRLYCSYTTCETIDESAFNDCVKLEEITLPSKLQNVKMYAFCGCTSLESITFPESIEYVDNYCMSGCINLKTIRLPKHMEGEYYIDEIDLIRMNPEIIYY